MGTGPLLIKQVMAYFAFHPKCLCGKKVDRKGKGTPLRREAPALSHGQPPGHPAGTAEAGLLGAGAWAGRILLSCPLQPVLGPLRTSSTCLPGRDVTTSCLGLEQ